MVKRYSNAKKQNEKALFYPKAKCCAHTNKIVGSGFLMGRYVATTGGKR